MKLGYIGFITLCLASLVVSSSAATHCVNLNSTNPISPYAGWDTAATNIQDAIDSSTNGDLILVTNGVYAVGGKSMDSVLTNRVSLDKAITVQSVSGPFVTTIQGAGAINGPAAVRCAWLTNNAALIGFTLRWGATLTSGNTSGGGVWCASSNAMVANCVIVSNTAYGYGGGAYQGTLENCLIASNVRAGGACNAVLLNCTVISNTFLGVYATSPQVIHATNCIVYFNKESPALAGYGNYSGAIVFSHCCTMPLPAGEGNFTNAPQFFVDGVIWRALHRALARAQMLPPAPIFSATRGLIRLRLVVSKLPIRCWFPHRKFN